MVMGTLGKYSRSVSIIGVGCTPFMYTVDNPETDGLTEGEMFGYAALKAMEDAGVNPQNVDFYFHGEASPLNGSNYLTPNVQVANWFGMKGKGSIHTRRHAVPAILPLSRRSTQWHPGNTTASSPEQLSSGTAPRPRLIMWKAPNIRTNGIR